MKIYRLNFLLIVIILSSFSIQATSASVCFQVSQKLEQEVFQNSFTLSRKDKNQIEQRSTMEPFSNLSFSAYKSEADAIPIVTNPITKRIWMDRNLGAVQVAIGPRDQLSFGSLYQWGRYSDGHQLRDSDTTRAIAYVHDAINNHEWKGKFILENEALVTGDWMDPQHHTLWQGINGINNVCPDGFRIPSESEWEDERKSWTSNDLAGAFLSPLKLTQGGNKYSADGAVTSIGFLGGYWSSTTDEAAAKLLIIYSSNAYIISDSRSYGHSVRCIKN